MRARIEAAPLPASLWQLLETCAEDSGPATVLDFFEDQHRMTYADLETAATRMAAGLHGMGVRKGTPVGLMTSNVIENPVAWFALLRLGAVTVPINPRFTARELGFVVSDAGIRVLIAGAETRDVVDACPEASDVTVVSIGAEPSASGRTWADLLATASTPPPETVGPDDLANIQYTSGTTGFPKGCLLTHRYWLQLGWTVAEDINTPLERLLVPQPLFYMEPLYVLVMTMFHRATFYCARRMSATRFIGWVKALRIDYCNFPEAVLRQPARPDDAENELRFVHTFGVRPDAHHAIEDRFRTVAREAYGTTEHGAVLYVPDDAVDQTGRGTCGVASPFREVMVADHEGRAVPPGEIGELLVRGPGQFLGYHGRPEATAGSRRDGWSRTGDMFRTDEQGWHFIVGRLADVIRRSSEFISAREVEHIIEGLSGIAQAAVIRVSDPLRGEEARACIVLAEPETPDTLQPETIALHCGRLLAPFKVPRFFTYLDDLPMTANGDKVDKASLQEIVKTADVRTFDRERACWA